MSRKSYIFVFQLTIAFLCLFNSANVYSQQFTEYELKAGYIIHFERFVEWPAPTPIFTIGLYGKDPFDFILEQMLLSKKNSSNKEWILDRISNMSTPENREAIDSCQILFISGVDQSQLIEILKYTKGKDILTVGDNIQNFCELGGIINFTAQGADKRFYINDLAAENSKLTISPKLLALAFLVRTSSTQID